MRIIEEKQVRELVSAGKCVELMKEALMGMEQGIYDMPPRLLCKMPNTATFAFMPAYAGDFFGAKVITAYGPNAGTEYPTHMGYVMLFESEHCSVAGLVDATAVTEIRTGAVSAAATDALARTDAHKLAIIGAGAQARSHVAAIRTIREITELSVYDLRKEAAVQFAKEIEAAYGLSVTICENVSETVYDADIICTLTPAIEAYLTKDMVKPGVHINAVGTFTPTTREVSSDLVSAAKLYADQIDAMKKESGEYLIPLQEGMITEKHIVGTVGQVLLGQAPGRENEKEITLFSALGLAIEDIACAKYAYEQFK